MQVEVVMPKMGESIQEGKILRWAKKVGDKIQKDETILEISTDKVDSEIPSPVSGILAKIVVAEQEVVPVGTVGLQLIFDAAGADTINVGHLQQDPSPIIAQTFEFNAWCRLCGQRLNRIAQQVDQYLLDLLSIGANRQCSVIAVQVQEDVLGLDLLRHQRPDALEQPPHADSRERRGGQGRKAAVGLHEVQQPAAAAVDCHDATQHLLAFGEGQFPGCRRSATLVDHRIAQQAAERLDRGDAHCANSESRSTTRSQMLAQVSRVP